MKTIALIALAVMAITAPVAFACDKDQLTYEEIALFRAKYPGAVCTVENPTPFSPNTYVYCKLPSGLWYVLVSWPTTNVSTNAQVWLRDVRGGYNFNYATATCSCDRRARTGTPCLFSR